MKKTIRAILIITVMLGLTSYVIYAAATSSRKNTEQKCKSVRVNVQDRDRIQFLTENDVKAFISNSQIPVVGEPMESINLENLELTVKDMSFVKTAECYKTHQGDLIIDVWQRQPVFRVMSGGKAFYIDEDAKEMPLSKDFIAYVPIVTGHADSTFLATDFYDFVIFLRKHSFWNALFEQIHITDKNEIELVSRLGSQLIVLGNLDNYQQKLDKLYVLYCQDPKKLNLGIYSHIDLRYKDQIVCKKKEVEEKI